MKIINLEILHKKGDFFDTPEFEKIISGIKYAISNVVWPGDASIFRINPQKKANGVKPIKTFCMQHLSQQGWLLEQRLNITSGRPGPLDAVLKISEDNFFALEWETGNISSSHRALNKMALGIQTQSLIGGILVLPSRKFYNYLTDRIGNYQELVPYFPLWKGLNINHGYLAIIEIEHDTEDNQVPLIGKGTDGWAKHQ
jgi:hypothetical protein